ncbi:hypothetical protein PR048_023369 [Dryococelus australis]|uniref:Uncharacterized protein n=1 Tax=Dryococelus australis TaxID=614101 RepID=A0ABQ9GTZ5_9NEOP|nr:hypothetical protein PR048_023369 [Dryococelus australis]
MLAQGQFTSLKRSVAAILSEPHTRRDPPAAVTISASSDIRLACSPPTRVNRVQSPAGSLPDFRMWESCRAMPLVEGFSRGISRPTVQLGVQLHLEERDKAGHVRYSQPTCRRSATAHLRSDHVQQLGYTKSNVLQLHSPGREGCEFLSISGNDSIATWRASDLRALWRVLRELVHCQAADDGIKRHQRSWRSTLQL